MMSKDIWVHPHSVTRMRLGKILAILDHCGMECKWSHIFTFEAVDRESSLFVHAIFFFEREPFFSSSFFAKDKRRNPPGEEPHDPPPPPHPKIFCNQQQFCLWLICKFAIITPRWIAIKVVAWQLLIFDFDRYFPHNMTCLGANVANKTPLTCFTGPPHHGNGADVNAIVNNASSSSAHGGEGCAVRRRGEQHNNDNDDDAGTRWWRWQQSCYHCRRCRGQQALAPSSLVEILTINIQSQQWWWRKGGRMRRQHNDRQRMADSG